MSPSRYREGRRAHRQELRTRSHHGFLLCDRLHAAFQRSQIIRTAAILQLLLGNIGRPGGGILALRGHSNVQGATDVPTLFNVLPNYIPQPEAHPGNATLADYLANGHGFSGALDKTSEGMWKLETERGSWASLPNYMVSLLKAYYGENATKDNEYGYQWLPKLSEQRSLTASWKKPFGAAWNAWW